MKSTERPTGSRCILFKSFILLIYWKFEFYFFSWYRNTDYKALIESTSATDTQPATAIIASKPATDTSSNPTESSSDIPSSPATTETGQCLFYVFSKCKNVNIRFPLHSNQMVKLINWYCSIVLITHFNHCFRFYISLNTINWHENKTINTIFVRFLFSTATATVIASTIAT